MTFYHPVILFIFLVYQLVAKQGVYERNVTVDILEYFIGLTSMIASYYTFEYLLK